MNSVAQEYLDLDPLGARIQAHRRWSERPDDVESVVIGAIGLIARKRLVDIGCGTGSFLSALASAGTAAALVGVDTSPAALDTIRAVAGVDAVRADAVELPFDNGSFDVLTARHMLYHVSDVDAALRECHRVLAPGGVFVAVVNHPDVTPNVVELVRAAVTEHGIDPPPRPIDRIHSDNLPALVEAVFGAVETERHDNALVFPRSEPLVEFAVALLGFYGVGTADDVRADVVDSIARRARAWFDRADAPWRDRKGYLVCVARRS